MVAKKYLMEIIGTFFLVLTIALTAGSTYGTPMAPVAIGGVLMIMVYMGGFVSGAHYNPAVTVGVFLRKKIDIVQAVIYIVAQVVGGLLAIMIANQVLDASFAGVVPDAVDGTKAFVAELLFTFALVSVVLHTAASKQVDGNSYFGFAIGMTVLVGAFAVGSISGGSFNPAVSLSAMFMGLDDPANIGLYVGAHVVAGVLASAVHGWTTK